MRTRVNAWVVVVLAIAGAGCAHVAKPRAAAPASPPPRAPQPAPKAPPAPAPTPPAAFESGGNYF